jgi:hypothetical protein
MEEKNKSMVEYKRIKSFPLKDPLNGSPAWGHLVSLHTGATRDIGAAAGERYTGAARKTQYPPGKAIRSTNVSMDNVLV